MRNTLAAQYVADCWMMVALKSDTPWTHHSFFPKAFLWQKTLVLNQWSLYIVWVPETGDPNIIMDTVQITSHEPF